MFNNFSFEYPYFLLLIPLYIICSIFCKEKSPSFLFIHLNLFNQSSSKTNFFIPLLKYLVIIFSVIALASPINKFQSESLKKDGIDIVLSLDTSGSMKEMGFNPSNIYENRWEVVKSIVNDFIDKRLNDNIALVIFGTKVMTASPLSYDKDVQKEILRYLDIGIVGEKTALVDSTVSAINILKKSSAKSKIVILLSDGMDTASKIPLTVANDLAIKYKIKLYTIGIGETNRVLLNSLSNQTGGKSFSAFSKDDLQTIYDEINNLEKSEIDDNRVELKKYLFFYPLFFSFLSLVLLIYLKNRN